MLGLSTGIKISILSESGHSTFVLCIKRESIDVERRGAHETRCSYSRDVMCVSHRQRKKDAF